MKSKLRSYVQHIGLSVLKQVMAVNTHLGGTSMLKKYMMPRKLQLVGKAWEIRHALRQEKKLSGGNLPLIELLSRGQRKSES
jgi:hypothetical protein